MGRKRKKKQYLCVTYFNGSCFGRCSQLRSFPSKSCISFSLEKQPILNSTRTSCLLLFHKRNVYFCELLTSKGEPQRLLFVSLPIKTDPMLMPFYTENTFVSPFVSQNKGKGEKPSAEKQQVISFQGVEQQPPPSPQQQEQQTEGRILTLKLLKQVSLRLKKKKKRGTCKLTEQRHLTST